MTSRGVAKEKSGCSLADYYRIAKHITKNSALSESSFDFPSCGRYGPSHAGQYRVFSLHTEPRLPGAFFFEPGTGSGAFEKATRFVQFDLGE
jgi:hypothetical protein